MSEIPGIDKGFIERLRKGGEAEAEAARAILYSRIFLYVQDRDIAEDITHKVIEKMLRKKWRDFRPQKGKGNVAANFRAWLKEVGRNAFLDYRRKRSREMTLSELSLAMGLDTNDLKALDGDYEVLDQMLSMEVFRRNPLKDNPLWKIDADKVIEAVMEVPERHKRMAFFLKFGYGFSIEETARIMKTNTDKITTDIYRTQKKVREVLLSWGFDASHLDPDTWREK